MTSNYNILYIHANKSNIEKYKAGGNFYINPNSILDSKIRRFHGLLIKSVGFHLGNICLEFDYNEWFYNRPRLYITDVVYMWIKKKN